LTERTTRHDRAAKVGEATIGDDDEFGAKRLLLFRAIPTRAYPNHAARERAFDQIRYGCFDEVDAGGSFGVYAEVLHESAVVERAALGTGGVWDMYGLSGVEDCVAVYGDSIDVVETGAETERAQCCNAAWLKKLADNAVWLGEGAFEEGYAEGCGTGCGGESVCEGGACDACADDDDVV